ncbi:flp pilus-assembly TadE/G-like family protein [Nocardioides KLBMP 9356]|uniref:Flp pilus-assembly TadE/G-like family protein n=1 Tax=Nocardioides potassii TaxID=2911371 RepID=A0ABS9H9R9_9ACTN|nr:Rv3654c family TadE-like protein [Nocardioides potassii]MCF6377951.1 flp pilus-assembly TadE/G-like family protein [Nocardioides potassii]
MKRGTEPGAARTDRGGATVLVVAMAGLLVFVMTGLGAAGGLVTAQRRAQAAADLAALAGASHLDDACGRAGEVATANGAVLEGCRLAGDEVTVEVSVPGPDVPRRDVRLTAEARAGPG